MGFSIFSVRYSPRPLCKQIFKSPVLLEVLTKSTKLKPEIGSKAAGGIEFMLFKWILDICGKLLAGVHLVRIKRKNRKIRFFIKRILVESHIFFMDISGSSTQYCHPPSTH